VPDVDDATADVAMGDTPNVVDEPDADIAEVAAASALARAREAARAKGLRPGSRPMRKRRAPGQQGNDSAGSAGSGRDPSLLGDQMDRLLLDRGWNVDVAVGAVMGRWADIVGSNVAAHCNAGDVQRRSPDRSRGLDGVDHPDAADVIVDPWAT